MKISIPDDYHDTLPTLDRFGKLSGHEVEVWNDHVQSANSRPRAWRGSPLTIRSKRAHGELELALAMDDQEKFLSRAE
jgi:hypothetical protein